MKPVNGTNNQIQAPYSLEAERAVLGALLLEPQSYINISEIVRPQDFFLKRHEHIFTAISHLFDSCEPADYVTVGAELDAMGVLDEIGGRAYLVSLVNETPSAVHIEAYARLVARTDSRRNLLKLSDTIRGLAVNEDVNVNQIYAEIDSEVERLSEREVLHRSRSAFEVADSMYTEFERRIQLYNTRKDYVLGVSTGFPTYDKLTEGIIPSYITILAGATGVGKTAWVLNVIYHALLRGIKLEETRPANVVIFSGEMTEEDLMIRMLSMMTGIASRKIKRGAFDDKSTQDQQLKSKIVGAISKYSQLPLFFETGQRLNTAGLRKAVRQYIAQGRLDLLVVDSVLQVDTNKSRRDQEQDWLKINMCMEELEDIALSYRIPILATAQLGRDAYNREPQLNDLKRASAIEEKSAIVNLLWRTEKLDDFGNPIMQCKIAKHRDGPTGAIDLFYDKPLTRFTELQRQ